MIGKRICRTCGHDKFDEVVDFGENPLVNSLIDGLDLDKKEDTYPLKVERCKNCTLVQIVDNIDSHKIYKDVDYLFFSSDMPTLKEYFQTFAEEVKKRFIKPFEFIVEIGSNDGVFLQNFRKDYDILGVDPSTNVALRAIERNIPTVPLFFNSNLARQIEFELGKAQVILGANCIAHIDDLDDVMRGVRILLADNGVFIVECNYWGGMVENKNYALIYHDHFSYFSLKNWIDFAEKHGLKVFDATVTEAQGGSLRVFMDRGVREKTKRLESFIYEEGQSGITTKKVCDQYRKDVQEKAANLFKLITDLKEAGKTVAGYGAAAKGFSILKLAGIDQRHLDYFVDDSPAKQGKYTPISHIPIISRQEANEKLPDYFFITAPNYSKVIIEKEKNYLADGGKFILEDGEIIG